MNGSSDAGLEELYSAVLDRIALYNVKFDMEYWYKNVGYKLHPLIASFASSSNEKFFVGANSTDGASPSPRSWTELSKIINIIEKKIPEKNKFKEILKIMTEARVGTEARIEFMKHVTLFMKFNFREVFRKKDPSFKVPADISDQILTSFMIRYMRTKEDADYLYNIISQNTDKSAFISVLTNDFVTLYHNKEEIQEKEKRDSIEYIAELMTSNDELNSVIFAKIAEAFADIQQ